MLVLTNSDVISAFNTLADYHEKAQSGTTTTLISNSIKDLDIDEVVGSYVCFHNGDNKGVDKIIDSYNDVDGEIMFDTLTTSVDNKTIFSITQKGFSSEIERAETILIQDLKNRGLDINLFLTPLDLKEIHLIKTLELVSFNKRRDTNDDDIFHISYLDFKEQYSQLLLNLVADYDLNEDGVISETEEENKVGQIVLGK